MPAGVLWVERIGEHGFAAVEEKQSSRKARKRPVHARGGAAGRNAATLQVWPLHTAATGRSAARHVSWATEGRRLAGDTCENPPAAHFRLPAPQSHIHQAYGLKARNKVKSRHWRRCEQASTPQRAGDGAGLQATGARGKLFGVTLDDSLHAQQHEADGKALQGNTRSATRRCVQVLHCTRTTRVMMKQVVATSAISWPMDATCRTSRLAVACGWSQSSTKTGRRRAQPHLHCNRAAGGGALGAQGQARGELRPTPAAGGSASQCVVCGVRATACAIEALAPVPSTKPVGLSDSRTTPAGPRTAARARRTDA